MSEFSTPKNSISAILITLNEEQNLKRCLSSIGFCDEIVVIDGGSSDKTEEIAKSCGAKFFVEAQWKGFGVQKSIALNRATGTWILSIDADEVVSSELRESIYAAIKQDSFSGFYVNRKTNFLGRWMRFGGWYPDRVLRLAKRQTCHFEQAPLHEKLVVQGRTSRLSGDLFHYSYPTVESALNKQVRYSMASAELKAAHYGKYSIFSAVIRALWNFSHNYFLRLGFLDGTEGLIAAVSKSQETFWKYAATSYHKKQQTGNTK